MGSGGPGISRRSLSRCSAEIETRVPILIGVPDVPRLFRAVFRGKVVIVEGVRPLAKLGFTPQTDSDLLRFEVELGRVEISFLLVDDAGLGGGGGGLGEEEARSEMGFS